MSLKSAVWLQTQFVCVFRNCKIKIQRNRKTTNVPLLICVHRIAKWFIRWGKSVILYLLRAVQSFFQRHFEAVMIDPVRYSNMTNGKQSDCKRSGKWSSLLWCIANTNNKFRLFYFLHNLHSVVKCTRRLRLSQSIERKIAKRSRKKQIELQQRLWIMHINSKFTGGRVTDECRMKLKTNSKERHTDDRSNKKYILTMIRKSTICRLIFKYCLRRTIGLFGGFFGWNLIEQNSRCTLDLSTLFWKLHESFSAHQSPNSTGLLT